MVGCTVSRYEQFETSPETIEHELRPAVCYHRQTQADRFKDNYRIDCNLCIEQKYSIDYCRTGLCCNNFPSVNTSVALKSSL